MPARYELPSDLAVRWEMGDILGTCDWGHCSRDQAGWAHGESDAPGEWLAICAGCARGEFPDANDDPVAVDEFFALPPDDALVVVVRGLVATREEQADG